MQQIKLKRVYDPVEAADGIRVLVDRLWPRGLTKENVAATVWLRDIAPSASLRIWYGHVPSRWDEFTKRYIAELESNGEPVARLRELMRDTDVTLLFSARSREQNAAVVLRDFILGLMHDEDLANK